MSFTVLLSVYHKERPCFLDMALSSIWNEQTLQPQQIVLVKDGPLPDSLEKIIETWRVVIGDVLEVISIKDNVGLASALNVGLEHCRYDLVARMDTDDISLPNRFMLQVKFMQKNPAISVCSGLIEEWDEKLEKLLSIRKLPNQHNDIIAFSKKRSPISHPAVIFRRLHVIEAGGYPDMYPEDYALWLKMLSMGYKFHNLKEPLVRMRVGGEFLSRRGRNFFAGEKKVLRFQLDNKLISPFEYCFYYTGRLILRNSPFFVKKIAYKYFR